MFYDAISLMLLRDPKLIRTTPPNWKLVLKSYSVVTFDPNPVSTGKSST